MSGAGAVRSARMTGTACRRGNHVYVDVCVGNGAVTIGSGFAVSLGFFEIFFFDYLFALDHTVSAVRAVVLALLPDGAAARTVLIVFNFGADDLFSF